MLCLHTQKPLSKLPHSDYSVSQEGVVYYERAASVDYGEDYFLKEYSNQYGKSYLEDEVSLRFLARQRLKTLISHRPPPATLFEIGCAAGFFLDEARKAGYTVKGLEISKFASDHAKNKLGLDVVNIPFERFSPELGFDVVSAYYVIEHFPDQKGVFAKISSLLNQNGLFSFAVPSTNGPVYKFNRQQFYATHPTDHFADYSPQSLKRILPLYGLKYVSGRPASFHPGRLHKIFAHKALRSFYVFFANLFTFGDTFEGLARKK